MYIFSPETCDDSTLQACDSLKLNVTPKTALLTLYGMYFDLQGHKSTERSPGQGRPLQAGRLWIVPSWNIYTVEDNRQVWD